MTLFDTPSLFDPPSLPADDRGLLLGDGLFETIRLYRGEPFRLSHHLRRLRDGAEVVGIAVPNGVEIRIDDALHSWGKADGALRLTLTRGAGPGLDSPQSSEGRLLIQLRSFDQDRSALVSGLSAIIRGCIDERSLTSGLKALGYLERIMALRLARAAGAGEALLQNSKGLLVEGSASNLFGVREGVLVAPGVREGALPGITREILLEEAQGIGIPVEVRGIAIEELTDLSELFLSSSLREITPLTQVEGGKIGGGIPGPVFRELAGRFAAVIEKEVGEGRQK